MKLSNTYKKIIDKLPLCRNSEFGGNQNDDYSDAKRLICHAIRDAEVPFASIAIKHGVSKIVLINSEDNTVLKIPFSGRWHKAEDENDYRNDTFYSESTIELYREEGLFEDHFYRFENAETADNYTWDYCAAEAYNYSIAEENGFGEFFAKTEFAGTTPSHYPIYLSEKVIVHAEQAPTPSDESLDLALDEMAFGELPPEWIANLIDKVGKERVDKLFDFLCDEDIGYHLGEDLHSKNVGYRISDGMPVILDYSDYNE